jgi:hypothetical protein
VIDFRLGRFALGVCVATAMLAGCGGAAVSSGVVSMNAAPDHLPNHRSFYYTGRAQNFRVPASVTHITVVGRGAHGAGSPAVDGGRVHAVIPVTPGEKLVVYVGGDVLEQLPALTAAAAAALAGTATAKRTDMAAAALPMCAREAIRFRIASWSSAAVVAMVEWRPVMTAPGPLAERAAEQLAATAAAERATWNAVAAAPAVRRLPAVPAAPAALDASDISEMLAVTARSAPEVRAEPAAQASTARIREVPVEAVVAAVITAVAVAARAVSQTAPIPPGAAEPAAARPTLSRAPRTCICGAGGKIQRTTGWSSSVGSEKNLATVTRSIGAAR